MLQLSSVKDKLTWKTFLVIGFYLAALIIFLAVYRPTQGRIERLEFELEQAAKREEALTRLVEERSASRPSCRSPKPPSSFIPDRSPPSMTWGRCWRRLNPSAAGMM